MSNQKQWKKRTIRGLLTHSKQGEIKSTFELARNYELGRYVEQDPKKSEEYDEKVLSAVDDFKLEIEELVLFQFRKFDKVKIEFNQNVTVLIGDNGSGKSTVLDAISKSLIWLPSNIINENTNCSLPPESDIKVGESYTYIDCQYSIKNKQIFQHIFSKAKKGQKSPVESEHEQIKLLGDIYRFANEKKEKFNLPIVAYYSIERSDEVKNRDFKTADSKADELVWDKFDGYKESLKNPQNFANFLSWFIRFDKIKSQSKVPLSQLSLLNADLDEIELEIKKSDKSLLDYLEKKKTQKQEAINNIRNELLGNQSIKCAEILEKVVDAISTFIPEIKNISIVHTTNAVDMLINKSGVEISATQLSQGEKSLMALVGDLARRLTMLNPSRENPFDGNGIVLIDEIDLHLHPSWQQMVVQKLKNTFSNIQFILTTHSPQVLSTVPKSSIRVLGRNLHDENVAVEPQAETYAYPNSDVMESVMHVKAIPNLPIIKELNEYREIVEQGDLKNSSVIEKLGILKGNLERVIGKNHPELLKLTMVKRRRDLLG